MPTATDYYAVLGVGREASGDDIKKAYRRLARQWHPDVNSAPEAQSKFAEVSEAYEVLSDPEKRERYDLGGDPFGNGNAAGFGFGGFSDIMDAFFGGGQPRGPRPRVQRGQDALIRVSVSLVEAAWGVTREVALNTAVVCGTCTGTGCAPNTSRGQCSMCRGRGEVQTVQTSLLGQVRTSRPCPQCQGYGDVIAQPCPDCAGEGRVRSRRTVSVGIPAGVSEGVRLHLSGQGECGPGGGPNGDLYVEVAEQPHPVFTRQGDDIHCALTVSMSAAALGSTVSVETLDPDTDAGASGAVGPRSQVQIEIKPGTQPGQLLRLKGKGVPRLRGGGRGDLLAHVRVEIPTTLTARQRELLEEFAGSRDDAAPRIGGVADEDDASGGFFSRLKDMFT